nr:hypothetical protein [Clostridioides sp.]
METDKIDENISQFKLDLLNEKLSIDDIIKKYIMLGTPYIFKDNEHQHYELLRKIAGFFNISERDVFIVGSSKLGFSISPKKLWNKIDWNEDEDSDIDVVVISDKTFDRYWKSILEYKDKQIPMTKDEKRHSEFLEYFFKGWIRPDKFPNKYNGADEWFEFFRSISYKENFGGRKVAVAIYKEEYFFMKYHKENLQYIKKILNSNT